MNKALIVGFVDKNRYVLIDGGGPVMVVVKMLDGYYAKYPDSGLKKKFLKILDVTTMEELTSYGPDAFFEDNSGRMLDIDRNEIAFAFSRKDVIVGTFKEVYLEIQKRLSSGTLSLKSSENLQYYLEHFKTDPKLNCYL